MNVGFIGLGLMGRPMALHLAMAGHTLHLWARRPASLEPFREGVAHLHISAAELARNVDIVFTMVGDADDVEAVVFGEDGLAGGAAGVVPPRLTIVDMSTIGPAHALPSAASASSMPRCRVARSAPSTPP